MEKPALINRFLKLRRVAFVGVSRNPRDFSRALFGDLVGRGYDVVPVNPYGVEALGRRSFPRVQDIHPPVEAALIMTPPGKTEDAIKDCVAAGVRFVWLHKGAGQGSVTPRALELCEEHGLDVVPGACPYMYLEYPGFVHSAHAFLRRVFARKDRAA
jgi:predicted CoA-binding protein